MQFWLEKGNQAGLFVLQSEYFQYAFLKLGLYIGKRLEKEI